MASVIRGDDNFDSSSVGPSTTYGDVGTYIIGARIQGRIAEGSTAAGSSIRNLTLHSYNTTSMTSGTRLSPAGYFYSSDLMSGTWRQMFDAVIGDSNNNARGGLWVRIS